MTYLTVNSGLLVGKLLDLYSGHGVVDISANILSHILSTDLYADRRVLQNGCSLKHIPFFWAKLSFYKSTGLNLPAEALCIFSFHASVQQHHGFWVETVSEPAALGLDAPEPSTSSKRVAEWLEVNLESWCVLLCMKVLLTWTGVCWTKKGKLGQEYVTELCALSNKVIATDKGGQEKWCKCEASFDVYSWTVRPGQEIGLRCRIRPIQAGFYFEIHTWALKQGDKEMTTKPHYLISKRDKTEPNKEANNFKEKPKEWTQNHSPKEVKKRTININHKTKSPDKTKPHHCVTWTREV